MKEEDCFLIEDLFEVGIDEEGDIFIERKMAELAVGA